MSDKFAKLNRLRVNAGKAELKFWKASQQKLEEAIEKLEEEGFQDVLPGANVEAVVSTDDPEVIAAREEDPPSIADSAMAKTVNNETPEPKREKPKASLARGLDTEPYARQSREKIRDIRRAEKRAEDAAKKKVKDKKKKAEPKGKVDPKKDPEKAARQAKHIEDKKKARAEKPAKEKNPNEITVAEIARELGIDPSVARSKLRRHEDKIMDLHSNPKQDRWTFPTKAKAAIAKILKGEK